MPIIETSTLTRLGQQPAFEQYQTYCGLDCCLTLEILEVFQETFPVEPQIYSFERALQGPYLEIMQRGFRVDDLSRRRAAEELHIRKDGLMAMLTEYSMAVWDRPLNPRSPTQLKDFFYQAMRLPELFIRQKGEAKLSTNREALEKLDEKYLHARPFARLILSIRDIDKQLEIFEKEIDLDGRFRTSYNIAGTETGRPSSSGSAYGTGGNAQNIAPNLRHVFVADPGKKICVIDLEQVEARDVGFFLGCLFDDWRFLDSCEGGDLHTNNAKLIWPEMAWTGDPKEDRKIAERPFYRDFSFRDMAKRGSHLSNYSGTAWTAARSLKVPLPIMEEFQARYCRGDTRRGIEPAFPGIPRWWRWTAEQLQLTQSLTTPFGRQRHFFGRPGDDTTLREAIAFLPQSTTADRMNLGMWRVWQAMPEIQLLAQTYDSITFQYDETRDEEAIILQALALIRVELIAPSNNRVYVVPGEAKVGWNWGAEVTEEDRAKARLAGKKVPRLNIGGLVKWRRAWKDPRKRLTGLQRISRGGR